MLWPKKNSYKEFDDENKFLRLENSPEKKGKFWSLLFSRLSAGKSEQMKNF